MPLCVSEDSWRSSGAACHAALQALIRKYVPLVAVILIVLLVLWARAKFY